MKLLKISPILGLVLFSATLAASSSAQTAGPSGGALSQTAPTGKTKHSLLNALNQLNLSSDQKTKVNQILNTRDHDDKAFKKAHKGDKLAIQAHNVAEKKAAMDGIKGILSPAQWDQLTTLLRHHKKARKA